MKLRSSGIIALIIVLLLLMNGLSTSYTNTPPKPKPDPDPIPPVIEQGYNIGTPGVSATDSEALGWGPSKMPAVVSVLSADQLSPAGIQFINHGAATFAPQEINIWKVYPDGSKTSEVDVMDGRTSMLIFMTYLSSTDPADIDPEEGKSETEAGIGTGSTLSDLLAAYGNATGCDITQIDGTSYKQVTLAQYLTSPDSDLNDFAILLYVGDIDGKAIADPNVTANLVAMNEDAPVTLTLHKMLILVQDGEVFSIYVSRRQYGPDAD
ncbi:MAG: hypothetical protein ACK5JF_00625 [Oscillospiraceae bacterium]